MSEVFVIQCPEEYSADLNELRQSLLDAGHTDPSMDQFEIIRVHPFDGQVLLQIVLPISSGIVTMAGIWIRSKYGHAKGLKVKAEGRNITIEGYTAKQVVDILDGLASDTAEDSQ